MKKTLHAVFPALLLLLLPVGGVMTAGAGDKESRLLVGVWQDAPAMGSGWSNAYQFFRNGTFVFHASQFDGEKREVSRAGVWHVRRGKLVLQITRRIVIEGGRREKAMGSVGTAYEIIGGTRRVKKVTPPQRIVLPLSSAPAREDPANKRVAIRLGATRFWKFDEDPSRYP